jgi:hypothetical protein
MAELHNLKMSEWKTRAVFFYFFPEKRSQAFCSFNGWNYKNPKSFNLEFVCITAKAIPLFIYVRHNIFPACWFALHVIIFPCSLIFLALLSDNTSDSRVQRFYKIRPFHAFPNYETNCSIICETMTDLFAVWKVKWP